MELIFRNFGPIREANFKLKPLTVIVGKNETGKSFILKALYAIFGAWSENENLTQDVVSKKLRWVFQTYLNKLIYTGEEKSLILIQPENIEKESFEEIRIVIKRNFKWKIQLFPSSSQLFKPKFKKVNFISIPTILDIEKAIAFYKNRLPNNYGVPDIYSDFILNIKDIGVAEKIELKRLYKKIEETIGGQFKYDTKQGIVFKRGKSVYKINLVADGIKLLGILQLLIERNLLTKNSLLILEEPEVHLHPSLKFKLINFLKMLSMEGIYVVFSTHSPEIIRYLEYLFKVGKLKKENISLIHLVLKGGYSKKSDTNSLEDLFDEILQNLTEDYFKLILKEQEELGEK
ncbi:MAG: hypothetical protein DSZ31_01075 [Gammaproteobacteria bacterium]|nr:MAG: hypothetical protein DSZ31_01075 [Gammaproteobacteria bacterium]RTZ68167.1 MAG: hypothetical protein DSZ30_04595 [Aquificaceae bacterium]